MDGCFQANILAVTETRPRFANSAAIPGPWQVVRILLLSGADLSTRALTPAQRRRAFGVCQDLTGGEALASYQSLYLAAPRYEAAPKCISGSTSYLQV